MTGVQTCALPIFSDGTVIFVDSPSLREIWGAQLRPFPEYCQVLPILYSFPYQWKVFPSLYRLDEHWEKKIISNGILKLAKEDGLIFNGTLWYSGPKRIVSTKNMILIQEKNGKLVRQSELISINGVKYQFKPLTASSVQSFQKKYLYDNIIPKTITPVNYLKPF